MATSQKLQVRIDNQLKAAAEAVFAAVGVDATTAVRMFYKKVAQTGSIPFRLNVAEPEFTPEQEARILLAARLAEDPKNLYGPFDSAEELIASLHARPSARAALQRKKKLQLKALLQSGKGGRKAARA
jgi:addiction module RelB/DinJ family antitoxin